MRMATIKPALSIEDSLVQVEMLKRKLSVGICRNNVDTAPSKRGVQCFSKPKQNLKS